MNQQTTSIYIEEDLDKDLRKIALLLFQTRHYAIDPRCKEDLRQTLLTLFKQTVGSG